MCHHVVFTPIAYFILKSILHIECGLALHYSLNLHIKVSDPLLHFVANSYILNLEYKEQVFFPIYPFSFQEWSLVTGPTWGMMRVLSDLILLSFFNRLNLKQKSLTTNLFQTTTNW